MFRLYVSVHTTRELGGKVTVCAGPQTRGRAGYFGFDQREEFC